MSITPNRLTACSSSAFKNTGRPDCVTPEVMIKKILVTKPEFYFDVSSARPTEADIQEAIQNENAFVFATVSEIEDASAERQDYEATSGETYQTRDAIKGMRPMFTLTAYEYKNYLSFNDKTVRVFEFDHKDNLVGCKLDGDEEKFAGFLTQRFSVENRTLPANSTSVKQTP